MIGGGAALQHEPGDAAAILDWPAAYLSKPVLAECRETVDAAIEKYEALTHEPIEAMFDHTFAKLPADLAMQRAAALAILED